MVLLSDTFGRGLALDIVLGVSMAPASVQMVLVEGENADGALVEDDEFDVVAADDVAAITPTDQVISAILGTREGAADAIMEAIDAEIALIICITDGIPVADMVKVKRSLSGSKSRPSR